MRAADGGWVYCICRVHHSVAIFKVDNDGDGGLLPAGRQMLAPGSNARNLAIAPSDNFVLFASQVEPPLRRLMRPRRPRRRIHRVPALLQKLPQLGQRTFLPLDVSHEATSEHCPGVAESRDAPAKSRGA